MAGYESFEAFYKGDVQGVLLTTIVPVVWLAVLLAWPGHARSRGVVPAAAGFFRVWAIVFTIETILDPLATGPLPRWLGLGDVNATWILVAFVLLGDYRVLLPFVRLARPDATTSAVFGEAAAWTLVVPIGTVVVHTALATMRPDLPGQTIWLVYEIGFACLAVYLRFAWLPREVPEGARRGYLEDLVEYALAYYLLWASADVLILVVGLDAGWALRVVPNQLYYSFTVPFAYLRFYTARER